MTKMVKGLKGKTCDEQLRSLGLIRLKKRRLRGDLYTVYTFLKAGSRGRGTDLLSLMINERAQGNGVKFHQRKVLCCESGQSLEQGPPRRGIMAPSLSEVKKHSGCYY